MDDKPDAVIIHIGTNDILTNANHEEIARNVIKIGLNCKNYGVNDVVTPSILVKKNPNLNVLTHFMPLFSFDNPWKHQKTKGFLMFSGGIERDQWHEKG